MAGTSMILRARRGRRLDRCDERRHHLRRASPAADDCACSRVGGSSASERVERQQQVRPPVAGPQHVPRPQDRRRDTGRRYCRLALLAHGDVRAHHRRRVRDAHVDDVGDAGARRGVRRSADRRQVDALELRGLRRTRMRRADEVDERGAVGIASANVAASSASPIAAAAPAGNRVAEALRVNACTRCPRASSAATSGRPT